MVRVIDGNRIGMRMRMEMSFRQLHRNMGGGRGEVYYVYYVLAVRRERDFYIRLYMCRSWLDLEAGSMLHTCPFLHEVYSM